MSPASGAFGNETGLKCTVRDSESRQSPDRCSDIVPRIESNAAPFWPAGTLNEGKLGALSDDEILERTLQRMGRMRRAIGQRYKWFYHLTPIGNVASIKTSGLKTNFDGYYPSPVVRELLGDRSEFITCVSPLGGDQVQPAVSKGPFACLAIVNEALPDRLGLDWSCVGAIGIMGQIWAGEPDMSLADAFVAAVKRWGTMAFYDDVPRDQLKICSRGCLPHDPGSWPRLIDVTDLDLVMSF